MHLIPLDAERDNVKVELQRQLLARHCGSRFSVSVRLGEAPSE